MEITERRHNPDAKNLIERLVRECLDAHRTPLGAGLPCFSTELDVAARGTTEDATPPPALLSLFLIARPKAVARPH